MASVSLGSKFARLMKLQGLHASDIAAPAPIRVVDGDKEIDVESLAPLLELLPEKQILRTVEAKQNRNASIAFAVARTW